MSINENFSYPLNDDWSTEEITKVVNFFADIEVAYTKGIGSKRLKQSYQAFLEVVPNKSEQKRLFREFKKNSGMEPFTAVKQLKDESIKKIMVK